ncbi:PAS domain S-box protein [Bacteroidota bacterium]
MNTLAELSKEELVRKVQDLQERVNTLENAEEELFNCKEKFEKSFRSNPALLAITKLDDGSIIEVNNSFLEHTEYKSEEIIGKTTSELNLWYDVNERHNFFDVIIKNKSMSNVKIRLKTKSGKIKPLLFTGELVELNGENHLITTAFDYTDREKAEAILKKSEATLKNIFKVAPTGIGIVKDRIIQFANDTFIDMVGYTEEELINQNARMVYPSYEEYEKVGRIKYEEIKKTGHGTVQTKLKNKDGSILDVLLSSIPINPDNLLEGVIFTVVNITEQEQTLKKIRESEKKYRELVEKAGAAIIIDDKKGNFNYYNDKFLQMFGYSDEEMKNQTKDTLIYKDDLEFVKKMHDERVANKDVPSSYQFRGITKDGTVIYLEVEAVTLIEDGEIIGTRSYIWNITEQKKMEKALASSEHEKSIILDSTSELITFYNTTTNIIWTNQAASDSISKRPKELIGLNCREVWALRGVYQKECPIENARNSKQPQQMEIATSDGKSWLIRIYPILNSNGEVENLVEFSLDISERKKAEKALKDSEEHYRTLIELSPDSIALTDLKGNFSLVNKKCAEILGYRNPEYMIGESSIEHIAPEDRERLIRNAEEAITEKSTKTAEFRYLRKDGSSFIGEANGYPLLDERQNPFAFLSIVRDITERKKMEEDLKESEQRFRVLFESAPDAYYLSDLKGNIVDGNKAAEDLVGYKRKELIGENFFKSRLMPKKNLPEAAILMSKSISGEPAGPIEFTLINKNKTEIPVEVRTIPVQLRNETYILGIGRDISERKKAEEKLHEKNEMLVMAQEIAAVGNWGWNIVTNEVFCSDQLYKIIGLNPDDEKISIELFLSLTHPDDLPLEREASKAALTTPGKFYDIEHRIIRPDGDILFVHSRGKVTKWGDNGNPMYMMGTTQDVTKRRRAEENLREREEQYRHLIEEIPGIVYRFSNKKGTLYTSQHVKDILGVDLEYLLENPFYWNNSVVDDDKERVSQIVKEFAEGKHFDFEYRIKDINGNTHWFRDRSIEIKTAGDETIVEGIATDITERKSIELSLKENERMMRNIIENSDEVFYIHNTNHVLSYVSPRCKDIFGYTSDEMKVKWTTFSTDNPINERGFELTEKAIKTGEKQESYILEINCKNSEKKFVEINESPVKDEKGNVVLLTGALRDITEKKNLDDALRESEEKYRTLTEMAQDSIYMIDKKGNIQFINKFGSELLGVSQKNIIGTSLDRWFPEETATYQKRDLKTVLDTGKSLHRENRRYVNNKEIWEDTRLVPVKDKSGKIKSVMGLSRDITDRKRTEDKIIAERQWFFSLLNNLPAYIYIQDNNYSIKYVNRYFHQYVGDPEENVPCYKTLKNLEEPCEECPVRDVFETNLPQTWIWDDSPDGKIYKVYDYPITDSDGSPLVLEMGIDITVQKKTEDALKESERKISTILSNIPGMAYRCLNDKNHTLKFVSSGCEKLMGYRPEELIENRKISFEELIFPEDKEIFKKKKYTKIKETSSENYELDYRIITRDGHVKWVSEKGVKTKIDQDGVEVLEGIIHDISEKKKAEEALRYSEQRLRTLIEHTTESIYCYEYFPPIPTNLTEQSQIDMLYEGVLVECNEVCARSYGVETPEDVIGRRLIENFGTESGSLDELFRSFIYDGYKSYNGESEEILEDGSKRYFLNNVVGVIENDKLLRIWGTSRDITELKKAEVALKESEVRLSSFMDSASDSFFLLDSNLNFTEINEAGLEILDKPKEEILGKNITEIVPDVKSSGRYEKHLRVLKTGEPFIIDHFVPHPKFGDRHFILKSFKTGTGLGVITTDITERKQAENLIRAQRDLGIAFAGSNSLEETLKLCLDTAMNISQMDVGGIYLVDQHTGALELIYENGLSKESISGISYYGPDTPNAKLVMAGKPIHTNCNAIDIPEEKEKLLKEGLRALTIIPIQFEGKTIAAVNLASRKFDKLPGNLCVAVENIIAQIGSSTAKSLAEEELKKEKKFTEDVINAQIDTLFVFDPKTGKAITWNKNFEKISGYSSNEIRERKVPDSYFSKEDLEIVATAMKKLFQTGSSRVEISLITKSGEKIPFEYTASKFKGTSGKPLIISVGRDITERRIAAQKLKEREATLRALINAPTETAILGDIEGRILTINETGAKRLGKSVNELIGLSMYDFLPEELAESRKQKGYEVIQTRKSLRFQDERSGRYFDNNIYPVFDADGNVNSVAVYARDITKQRTSELALRNSNERLNLALEGTNTGLWEWYPKTNKTYFSPTWFTMLGYKPDEFEPKYESWASLLHPDDRLSVEKIIKNFINNKELYFSAEIRMRAQNGEYRWIYDQGKAIEWDENRNTLRVIGTHSDITERKKAENQLIEKEETMSFLARTGTDLVSLDVKENMYKFIADNVYKIINGDGIVVVNDYDENFEHWHIRAVRGIGDKLNRVIKLIGKDVIGLSGKVPPKNKQLLQSGKLEDIGKDIHELSGRLIPKKLVPVIFKLFNFETFYGIGFKQKGKIYGNVVVMKFNSGVSLNTKLLHAFVAQLSVAMEKNFVENKLQESEEFHRKIFESSTDCLVIADFKGNIIDANPAACKTYGYSHEEFISLNALQLIRSDYHKEFQRFVKTLKPNRIFTGETIDIRKDGTNFFTEVTGSIIQYKGTPCMLAVVRDITERKIAERAIRESEEKYRSLFNDALDMIHIIDTNGRIIEANKSEMRKLGYSRKEFIGKKLSDFIHPYYKLETVKSLKKALNGAEIKGYETVLLTKNGKQVFVEASAVPQFVSGKVITARGILHDISERKLAERKIIEERNIAEKYFQTAGVIMLVLDRKANVELINDKGSEILGYTKKYIIGKNWIDNFIPPEDRKDIKKVFNEIVTGDAYLEEYHENQILCRYNKIKTVGWQNTVLKDDDGKIVGTLSSGEDITETLKMTNEIKKSHEELTALSNHMEKVREDEKAFISREIHDTLGQAITALKLDIDWLSKSIKNPEKNILKKLTAMSMLADETVEKVQKMAFELRPDLLDHLGLIAAIEWQLEELSDRTPIKFELVSNIQEPELTTDVSTGLFRVFQEALRNVVRHSQAKNCSIIISKKDGCTILRISDDGIGIQKSTAESSKSLGLIGMRERVRSFGGELLIEGQKKNGTIVTVKCKKCEYSQI